MYFTRRIVYLMCLSAIMALAAFVASLGLCFLMCARWCSTCVNSVFVTSCCMLEPLCHLLQSNILLYVVV